MKSKQIDQSPKTFILVFETGDELAKGLLEFAEQEKLSAASFKAVGALSSVHLGWFSWESKKYEPSVTLDEQVELLSLIGDVALKDGKPVVHAHAVIGKKDGTAHGGHLLEAHIRPTCEVILTESPIHLQKQIDPESGLALIRPSKEDIDVTSCLRAQFWVSARRCPIGHDRSLCLHQARRTC
jgi:uncharacterized protein